MQTLALLGFSQLELTNLWCLRQGSRPERLIYLLCSMLRRLSSEIIAAEFHNHPIEPILISFLCICSFWFALLCQNLLLVYKLYSYYTLQTPLAIC